MLGPSTDRALPRFLEDRAVDRFAQVESGRAKLIANRAHGREQAAPLRQDEDAGAADHGQAALGRDAPTVPVVHQEQHRLAGLQCESDRHGLAGVGIAGEAVGGGRAERGLFPDPWGTRDLMGARPADAADGDLRPPRWRDDDLAEEFVDELQPADRGVQDQRAGVADDRHVMAGAGNARRPLAGAAVGDRG